MITEEMNYNVSIITFFQKSQSLTETWLYVFYFQTWPYYSCANGDFVFPTHPVLVDFHQ